MSETPITPEMIVKRLATLSVEELKAVIEHLGIGMHTMSSFRRNPLANHLDEIQLTKLVRRLVGRQNIHLVDGHFVTVHEQAAMPLGVRAPAHKRTESGYYDAETGRQGPNHAKAPRPVAQPKKQSALGRALGKQEVIPLNNGYITS